MKRFLCLLLAAALLVPAAGCGRLIDGGDVITDIGENTRPTSAPAPDSTPRTADGTGYDNTITLVNGAVEGTEFNWNYFVTKADNGFPGIITVVFSDNGVSGEYEISYAAGAFTLKDGQERAFKALARFETSSASGERYSVAVLTDDGDLTADSFFGGAPETVYVGQTNAGGVVVYAKKL